MMNILELDVYSLRKIFSMLEPESYINIMQTCQTFRKLACDCDKIIDKKIWRNYLKKQFLQLIDTVVDSDSMDNTEDGYYVLLVSLKAYLQTIKMTNFLQYYETYSENINNKDFLKLILKAAESKDFCLDQVIRLSQHRDMYANFSYLFTFDLEDGVRLIICCCPSSSHRYFFVVNDKKTQLYFMDWEDDWSWKMLTFDADHQSGMYSSEAISEEKVKDIVRKLSSLVFDSDNYLTLATFLEFFRFVFPEASVKEKTDAAYILSNSTQVTINKLHCDFKSKVTEMISFLPYEDEDRFINFFKLLNVFGNLSDFNSIVTYTQSLVRCSAPFTRVLFNLGFEDCEEFLMIAEYFNIHLNVFDNAEADFFDKSRNGEVAVKLNMEPFIVVIKRILGDEWGDFTIVVRNVLTSEFYQFVLEKAEDKQLDDLVELFHNFGSSKVMDYSSIFLVPEAGFSFVKIFSTCILSINPVERCDNLSF